MITLLDTALSAGLKADYVLFDSWFSNPAQITAISHMLGHSKEIISADVYGDTAEIIEDCLYAIEPFMEEVLPESREEKYYDYSDLKEIDEAAEEYLMAA